MLYYSEENKWQNNAGWLKCTYEMREEKKNIPMIRLDTSEQPSLSWVSKGLGMVGLAGCTAVWEMPGWNTCRLSSLDSMAYHRHTRDIVTRQRWKQGPMFLKSEIIGKMLHKYDDS